MVFSVCKLYETSNKLYYKHVQKQDMMSGMPVTGKVLLISVLLYMVWNNSDGLLTWWAFVTWCLEAFLVSDVMSVFWQKTFVLLFLHFGVYIFVNCLLACILMFLGTKLHSSENELYSHGQSRNLTFMWLQYFGVKKSLVKVHIMWQFCQWLYH